MIRTNEEKNVNEATAWNIIGTLIMEELSMQHAKGSDEKVEYPDPEIKLESKHRKHPSTHCDHGVIEGMALAEN